MSDSSGVFNMEALEESDIYFKRSYHAPDLDALRPELRSRILPGTLNFACRTPASSRRLLPFLVGLYGSRALTRPVSTLRNLDLYQRVAGSFVRGPMLSDFEYAPDAPVDRVILFQTRVWHPIELGPDAADEVNLKRVQLVRALKAEFGPLFRGGLVPDEYARRHYPDAVTAEPVRRAHFIAGSKRAFIGIYTRGLHHSLAFKLPEYLASSKCIVSEPLRNRLAHPLAAGRNYLEFLSIDECIGHCARLLADRELAEGMRRDNWHYYRAHVHPARSLAGCLESAFACEDSLTGACHGN